MSQKSYKIQKLDPYSNPNSPQYHNTHFLTQRLKANYRMKCNGIVLDLNPTNNQNKSENRFKDKISNITKNIKLLLKGKLQFKDLLNKGEIEDEKTSSR